MSLLKLINEFAKREVVPVEVDDVVDFIRRLGIADEIYFWDADFNTDIVKGTLHHWEYQMDGWTVRVADIHTAKSLPLEEKRLAEVKELLHILDQRVDRADTAEDVAALIEKIVLPPNLVTDGNQVWSDRIAILHAVAVLLPMATRNLLLPKLRQGKITLDEIAELVAIPKPYVVVAMSDDWVIHHQAMIVLLETFERTPDRVLTLDANHSTIENHSVPLETDPYSYAKRLEEQDRERAKPAAAFMVQTRRGYRTFSRSELAAYVPRNGFKPR